MLWPVHVVAFAVAVTHGGPALRAVAGGGGVLHGGPRHDDPQHRRAHHRFAAPPRQIIHGIHLACLALGGATVFSALLFRGLRPDDGATVSRQDIAAPTAARPD